MIFSVLVLATLGLVPQSAEAYLSQPQVDAWVTPTVSGQLFVGWNLESTKVTIYRSDRPDQFPRQAITTIKAEKSAIVDSLPNRKRTYFKLIFSGHRSLIVADRFLHFQGAENFRDLGGYSTTDGKHVRWGKLFRSNALSSLAPEDVQYLVTDLHLKKDFDVRGDSEVNAAPDHVTNMKYTRLPISSDGFMKVKVTPQEGEPFGQAFLKAGYISAVDEHSKDVFGAWIKTLAESNDSTPSVLHCTAGKDRTGVAYGILLSILGVPRKTILDDYSLTNLTYPDLEKQFSKSNYPAAYRQLLIAYPQALNATLDHLIAKYGSIESYATSMGITPQDILDLKARFLE